MTIVVVAFLSQVQTELHGTTTSTGIVQTHILAESTVETIVRDLRDEMLAGAANDPQVAADGSMDPMQVAPKNDNVRNVTPGAWWAAVPSRVIADFGSVPSSSYANLVKQSLSGKPFYPGTSPPAIYTAKTLGGAITGKSRASNVSTAAPALDGRFVSPDRWSTSGLLGQDLTASQAPNWIYINRRGSLDDGSVLNTPAGVATASDASSGNEQFVVGRAAYNIYDTGGLLNANVVGFPPASSNDTVLHKGSPAWADGTAIGMTQDQVNRLVGWRNSVSQGTFSPFDNYVHNWGEMQGFLQPYTTASASGTASNPRTDGYLFGRQDLIHYWLHDNGATSYKDLVAKHPEQRAILAKLTGFSAFSTSPSAWSFGTNRPAIQQPNSGGNNTYNKDSLTGVRWHDLFNRYFVQIKVNKPGLTRYRKTPGQATAANVFTRQVTAQKGEALVNSRFPLSRISLVTSGGSDSDAIYRFFGLNKAGDGSWIYYHGATTSGQATLNDYGRIMSLAEVSADPVLYPNGTSTTSAPREPDFFELLQASIDTASTGKSCGTAAGSNDLHLRDEITQFQIMQIGANILGQADPSGMPIQIKFSPASIPSGSGDPGYRMFSGIKNLPYITRVRVILVQVDGPGMSGSTYPRYVYGIYIQPEVWNPHDNSVPPPADTPKWFRVMANSNGATVTGVYGPNYKYSFDPVTLTAGTNGVVFTTANGLSLTEPLLLSRTGSTNPNVFPNVGSVNGAPPHASDLVGICAGALELSQSIFTTSGTSTVPFFLATNNNLTFEVQYSQTKDGQWTTYGKYDFIGLNLLSSLNGNANPDESSVAGNNYSGKTISADPRTDRFGWFGVNGYDNRPELYPFNMTVRPKTLAGFGSWTMDFASNATPPVGPSPAACGWTLTGVDPPGDPNAKAIGPINQNNPASGMTYYKDADGIVRGGDGFYFPGGNTPTGLMLFTGNSISRPVILNRPFKSVGELGYAFRDTPLKSIDFFTANSGDASLLDTFCIDEQPDNGVVSGHISLNTRQPDVLSAVISNTLCIEPNPTSGADIDLATAQQTIVPLITALTAGTASDEGPITNRSEIATRILPKVVSLLGGRNWLIKRRAETLVRALADSTETGTWNLMVDMVVQSGRFPAGQTNPTADRFLVSGETRQWVHLAVDRTTGKVVASLVEPVHE